MTIQVKPKWAEVAEMNPLIADKTLTEIAQMLLTWKLDVEEKAALGAVLAVAWVEFLEGPQ